MYIIVQHYRYLFSRAYNVEFFVYIDLYFSMSGYTFTRNIILVLSAIDITVVLLCLGSYPVTYASIIKRWLCPLCHVYEWYPGPWSNTINSDVQLINSLLPMGEEAVISKVSFSNSLYRRETWVLAVELLSGECHRTSLMRSQHWGR